MGQKQVGEKRIQAAQNSPQEHLLRARRCTWHLVSHHPVPARVLHLQLAPNKHLLVTVSSTICTGCSPHSQVRKLGLREIK